MKIVLLSVPYCEPFPMVAPVLLSACLNRSGISAVGIDFNIAFLKEFSDQPWFSDFKIMLCMGHIFSSKFERKVFKDVYRFTRNFLQQVHRDYQPEWVGLSIFTSESLDFGLIMSYMLRRHWPNTRIIAGGKGLEVTHNDQVKHYNIWIDNGIADTVIVGDAEAEVINTIRENKTGLIQATQQTKQDLDDIPVPEWSSYDLLQYSNQDLDQEAYMTVTGSKGCVRKCTFCDVGDFWPDFIYRDPIKVANEIIHNYHSTGIRNFEFTDNLINGSISNYRTMNQRLVEVIPGKISYNGFAIFRGKEQMPIQDFRLAAQAGCKLWAVGVESGSERVRWAMKKKFSNNDIDWSVNALHSNGIAHAWLLMVGYPSETESDFQETKALLRRYAHLAPNRMIQLNITPTFSLLNNSPLLKQSELAVEYGLDRHATWTNDKFWTSTVYVDNDYPTRSRWWKELVSLALELGYSFKSTAMIDKYSQEITNLDRVYNETHRKVFTIRSGQ